MKSNSLWFSIWSNCSQYKRFVHAWRFDSLCQRHWERRLSFGCLFAIRNTLVWIGKYSFFYFDFFLIFNIWFNIGDWSLVWRRPNCSRRHSARSRHYLYSCRVSAKSLIFFDFNLFQLDSSTHLKFISKIISKLILNLLFQKSFQNSF